MKNIKKLASGLILAICAIFTTSSLSVHAILEGVKPSKNNYFGTHITNAFRNDTQEAINHLLPFSSFEDFAQTEVPGVDLNAFNQESVKALEACIKTLNGLWTYLMSGTSTETIFNNSKLYRLESQIEQLGHANGAKIANLRAGTISESDYFDLKDNAITNYFNHLQEMARILHWLETVRLLQEQNDRLL